MKLDIAAIGERVDKKLITVKKHSRLDLYIYNYTHQVQYDRLWDEWTSVCRGLIADGQGDVVANPFPKFFNIGEKEQTKPENLPAEVPVIEEKMDGCFRFDTPLSLWSGGTVLIGDVVNKRLRPTLMGVDRNGKIVPCHVVEHFKSRAKNDWLVLEVDCPVSKLSGAANKPNVIRVTPNHHIMLNGRFIPASRAKRGDTVTTFEYRPSSTVMHLIESSLLGDGSLPPTHRSFRFQEPHVKRHHQYVTCLRSWLGECSVKPRTTMSGFGSVLFWANSKAYKSLKDVRLRWYRNSKKAPPEDLSWMDDFSVAKWYMDDGSISHSRYQKDRIVFSTHAFSKKDVARLAQRLHEMYGVSCSLQHSRGWFIRVNAGRDGSIDRMWKAIAPHIVQCMRYKLSRAYRNVPYVPYPNGQNNAVRVSAKVVRVRRIAATKRNFPAGRTGFDIRTTTGNYFAKGILVHNSLGISYFDGDLPCISTRGSFESPQAEWATKWLRAKGLKRSDFKPGVTYLFEIIYPANRIVVDYKGRQEMVLLAVRDTETGAEGDRAAEAARLGFAVPRMFPITSVTSAERELEAIPGLDLEGFVVRYSNGLRCKMKSSDYKRLHRILTATSTVAVWEMLAGSGSIDDLLKSVPDEFYQWLRKQVDGMNAARSEIMKTAGAAHESIRNLPTRKEQALKLIADHPNVKSIVFKLLDRNQKDAERIAWDMVRPDHGRVFASVGEDI